MTLRRSTRARRLKFYLNILRKLSKRGWTMSATTADIEKGLDNVRDNGGSLADQIALVNRLVDAVKIETREDSFGDMSVDRQAEQLLALFDKQDSILAVNEKAQIVRPVTSLAHSSLFTGAVREPQLGSELKKEIASCDRIDMLVSFIKWSGLRQILEDLKVFVQRGGILRIITTSYMGATDLKAIEELAKLPKLTCKDVCLLPQYGFYHGVHRFIQSF